MVFLRRYCSRILLLKDIEVEIHLDEKITISGILFPFICEKYDFDLLVIMNGQIECPGGDHRVGSSQEVITYGLDPSLPITPRISPHNERHAVACL